MDEQEKKQSYILIQFSDFGSTNYSIKFGNVTTEQVMLAGMVLKLSGENAFTRHQNVEMEQQEQMKLVVPDQKIIKPSR